MLARLAAQLATNDGGGQKDDSEGGGDTDLTRDRSGYSDLGAGGAVGARDGLFAPQLLRRAARYMRGGICDSLALFTHSVTDRGGRLYALRVSSVSVSEFTALLS